MATLAQPKVQAHQNYSSTSLGQSTMNHWIQTSHTSFCRCLDQASFPKVFPHPFPPASYELSHGLQHPSPDISEATSHPFLQPSSISTLHLETNPLHDTQEVETAKKNLYFFLTFSIFTQNKKNK